MKRVLLFISLVTLSFPVTSFAQNSNEVTGAMIVTTTETIVKEPVNVPKEKTVQTYTKPKFTMMGQVGFFIGTTAGVDAHFLAGYTFRDRVFVGAGVGIDIDLSSESVVTAPLYANSRIYFTKNTKVRPFVDLSVGGNIPWGVYANASIGADFPLSKKLSLYAKVGYEVMHGDYYDDYYYNGYYYGYYDYEDLVAHDFSLKIGLKF